MSPQRTLVVTGSTCGIGFGIARELLKRGQNVVVSGRTQAAVDRALAELQTAIAGGAKVAGFPCDVSKRADLQRLWDGAVATFGRVDIWVNNAGVSPDRHPVGELSADDIRTTQETNLLGMMHATQVALEGMKQQPGGGFIYNMEGFGSSGMTAEGISLYGSSKFALTYFNKCLIAETKGSPVKVCYLSPGIVVTDLLMKDMGRRGTPQWERALRVYNILGDRVETVTPYLAEGLLRNDRAGGRVAWLSGGKAGARFFMALFRKRQLLTEADLQAG